MIGILVRRNSTHETHGPFTSEELARWAGDGMVSGEDSISFDSGVTWHGAAAIMTGYLEFVPAERITPILGRRHSMPRPLDLAPMIDVVFLLLIFFMVTARLEATSDNAAEDQARRDVTVSVPEVEAQPSIKNAGSLTIAVSSEDEISFEGRKLTLTEVLSELEMVRSRQNVPLTIIVEADGAMRYESVVKVVARLEAAEIGPVMLSTVANGD